MIFFFALNSNYFILILSAALIDINPETTKKIQKTKSQEIDKTETPGVL
jgi:hypothetical protein